MNCYKQLLGQYACLVSDPMPPVQPYSLFFFGFLLLAVGIVSMIFPRLFWHLRIGRKVPHVEPSSLYLMMLRFGGLLTVALGLVFFYQAWLHS